MSSLPEPLNTVIDLDMMKKIEDYVDSTSPFKRGTPEWHTAVKVMCEIHQEMKNIKLKDLK